MSGERLTIQWKKPYSFLMRPALLKEKSKIENQDEKGAAGKSSRKSYRAPPVGLFQNAINSVIEDFLLYLAG